MSNVYSIIQWNIQQDHNSIYNNLYLNNEDINVKDNSVKHLFSQFHIQVKYLLIQLIINLNCLLSQLLTLGRSRLVLSMLSEKEELKLFKNLKKINLQILPSPMIIKRARSTKRRKKKLMEMSKYAKIVLCSI